MEVWRLRCQRECGVYVSRDVDGSVAFTCKWECGSYVSRDVKASIRFTYERDVNASIRFTYARRRQSCMGLLTGNGAWRGLEKGSTVFRRVQLTCVQEKR